MRPAKYILLAAVMGCSPMAYAGDCFLTDSVNHPGKDFMDFNTVSVSQFALPYSNPRQNNSFLDKATGNWGGARDKLKKAGISIDAELVLEGFRNFMGGLNSSRTVGAYTLDLSMTLDTDKLLGWPGGTFYIDFEDHEGKNPSDLLVGDLQIFDKLNSSPYVQIFEAWYEQKLFEDRLRIKVGKVDTNTEFSVTDNGLDFLNSSTQVSPTCFLMPTTPDPMPGLNVFFTPNQTYFASFGIYYANRSEHFGVIRGTPQDAQLSDFGAFLIGEGGIKWDSSILFEHDGNFKIGAWKHTGTFTTFDNSEQNGTDGFYAIFNQTLSQPPGAEKDGPGIRMFLDGGQTHRNINAINQHIGGGLTWTGLLPERPEDILGFSPQFAHISDEAGLPQSYELALETFYKVQLTKWAAVQPDLQYIVNPGGQYPDALVLTIRTNMHF
jgi:porin